MCLALAPLNRKRQFYMFRLSAFNCKEERLKKHALSDLSAYELSTRAVSGRCRKGAGATLPSRAGSASLHSKNKYAESMRVAT